jgi:glycerophosphoryl diester phosphodiesterase
MNWGDFRQERLRRKKPFVMAHRGAQTIAPENTLAAFALALNQGAEILETDLRFTNDKEIVLIHDPDLDRTTDGTGSVADLTLSEIKRYKTKVPSDDTSYEEKVPTLEELMILTQVQIPLALELKDPRFEEHDYAERLISCLSNLGVLEICAVVSFNFPRLYAIKKACPSILTGHISAYNPFPIRPAEMLGPYWPLMLINPFYVQWAHWQGRIVCPLDPYPELRMKAFLKLGVDVVLANRPKEALDAIERLAQP